ncbi:hypothetical protein H072_4669 [Dactylellina haptotyla CBS 200.50]|uniref:F-box domain-containing protein n=1 Tax=Dactylellina haptotyla (strain CBS 200.50) TaxID=1284197 RepID=S8AJX2_DACHA|nr:hypothetical protein H072_4669 [Dactylellina haptotyla CBS 200.50]
MADVPEHQTSQPNYEADDPSASQEANGLVEPEGLPSADIQSGTYMPDFSSQDPLSLTHTQEPAEPTIRSPGTTIMSLPVELHMKILSDPDLERLAAQLILSNVCKLWEDIISTDKHFKGQRYCNGIPILLLSMLGPKSANIYTFYLKDGKIQSIKIEFYSVLDAWEEVKCIEILPCKLLDEGICDENLYAIEGISSMFRALEDTWGFDAWEWDTIRCKRCPTIREVVNDIAMKLREGVNRSGNRLPKTAWDPDIQILKCYCGNVDIEYDGSDPVEPKRISMRLNWITQNN